MRVIFSRDRAAQLDLLLRSLTRHAEPEPITIIWQVSSESFRRGYDQISGHRMIESIFLHDALREALVGDEVVTFFCDDNIVYREIPSTVYDLLLSSDEIVAVNLHLGRGNTQQPLPPGFPIWRWDLCPRHDFGYPASIDGNAFRVDDVLRLLGDSWVMHPTELETIMDERIASLGRPLMASFEEQCVVNTPVNRVSQVSECPWGERFPQSTRELNERFLAGERIDLDALDFSGIHSLHHELAFQWSVTADVA